jgi:NADH-quinone oxidoreductase subunit K
MNFLVFSIYLNDSLGQICSIFVLTTAAAESSIGLAILIIAYKTLKSLEMIELTLARQ